MIVHNAVIYTVDGDFSVVEAFAIKDGLILETGTSKHILEKYEAQEVMDAKGLFIYPGFIDAHTHFYRYGLGLKVADLTGAKSEAEMIERVQQHRTNTPDQAWILGRGWDQNLWEGQHFPSKSTLDSLYPDIPVLLTRIDGHAALANSKALAMGGITPKETILGGKVITQNGKMTGVLIDNAIDLVSANIPDVSESDAREALLAAQKNCFEVGLTTVADAGLDKETILLIEQMQKEEELMMRVYAMINPSPENKEYFFEKGPYQNESLTVRSFKVYGDGALGSRGASLLRPYHDAPEESGFLLDQPEHFLALAEELNEKGFQMNTHCIGDSANRTLLNIYGKVLLGENDKRWRIEHAQVIHPMDIEKFAKFNIIPSVQPTHATSDMGWAADRLGEDRVKHAYTYQLLEQQNDMLALGSDFPVEDINPLYGYHAAVARTDGNNKPEGGFQPENKLSRQSALKGMTIWAAYANFEEPLKGSIEKGKLADFVVMERDLMTAPETILRELKIQATYIGGQKVY
ncbi:amidohydrolase [Echinicola pacifica]|uniref:Amidohydrolase n=2 Tax=Echinicola pacifica TaxID=346377 RepID=A0A918UX68_9BACT|nr:amidohydrolase [Echinicola pacifica]